MGRHIIPWDTIGRSNDPMEWSPAVFHPREGRMRRASIDYFYKWLKMRASPVLDYH